MSMDIMAKVMFAAYAAIIIAGGLLAVSARSLIRALLGLILTFFGVAGMYLLLAAPFMALMQLLIYLGAVVVLIFFAIMLTRAPAGAEECEIRSGRDVLLATLVGVLPALSLGAAVWRGVRPLRDVPAEVSLDLLGQGLLGQYAFVFELISLVLMVSMAGAVLVGWERRQTK